MRVSPGVQCVLVALLLSGCAWHRKPKSYNRIVLEGDPNPTIVEAPARAGDTVRTSDRLRHPPRPFPAESTESYPGAPTQASPTLQPQ